MVLGVVLLLLLLVVVFNIKILSVYIDVRFRINERMNKIM